MQWVVTTGRTVDEARNRALDALGIDESDLEYEVLDEPRSALFGLRQTDARVRARVRPTRPRPKIDRRNRRKSSTRAGKRRKSKKQPTGRGPAGKDRSDTGRDRDAGNGDDTGSGPVRGDGGSSDVRSTNEPATDTAATTPSNDHDTPPREATGATMSDIPLADQEPTAVGFLEGLLDAFDVDADVEASVTDDDTLEVSVDGDDLGLLVGPRGATLNALQELTRTAVAQQHSGRLEGRLRVDVAGYRARRKEALIRFVNQQADRVKETGARVALEPMSPPDRKIVHDAVNEIDGVHTVSEGEDRRRHVVILPDD